ncbi:hypothetical protein ASPZODRAFT_54904 [Penicilliopsis zonata CBS 506.65]|uniref:D-xylose reductase [NAD(P)H] n=1 Tax=Penicilliopsis zonata CBS 506.65 TaxID=1073090 RepID=A0A1L9STZ1_9EURO|nr:hypothetical protein ASPZODRAFT_54904 [Penicilliopsis zonata CBS 506.65]OJJ50668.1 hypothetical protein ASPZODRAFT_54904 [Penicilliopsis zonata CBS 506.65]
MPRITIGGRSVPQLAFGMGTSWSKRGDPALNRALVDTIKSAIGIGFTHLDCADAYGTEQELGVAIKEVEAEKGIPRSDLFVTTKCMKGTHDLPAALAASLKALQLDYVDLYLIHTPFNFKSADEISAAWVQMEQLQSQGLARSIGVSNFRPKELEVILKTCKTVPAVNQIERHPYLQRPLLTELMNKHGIATVAYGPLTSLRKATGGPVDGYIATLAAKYGVTEDNILLRWQMDKGIALVTTSSKPSRLEGYLQTTEFTLAPEESAEIDRLGAQHHFRAYLVGPGKFTPEEQD